VTPEDRASLAEFFQRISERQEQAASEYGDTAKTRPASELFDEVAEELLDVCGWSFWLWRRVQTCAERLREVELRE
jgi:hypothetical protein